MLIIYPHKQWWVGFFSFLAVLGLHCGLWASLVEVAWLQ